MKPRGPQKKDKWIPWYFVAFFLVLFVLDGIFVSLALSTHRGVVTDNAYDKGLKYNQTVEAVESQKALGWNGEIQLAEGNLHFTLQDAQGAVLQGANVTAHLSRPTQAGDDFAVTLDSLAEKGYRKAIDFPHLGQWDVVVLAKLNGKIYQQRKRLVVK